MAGRILIAEDAATNRIALMARLSAVAYDVSMADTGAAALDLVRRTTHDLILLSATLSDIDPCSLVRSLRSQDSTAQTPILLLGPPADRIVRLSYLKAGADAVVRRPFDFAILRARIRNLMRRQAGERDLARDEAAAGSYGFAEAPQGFSAPQRVALVTPDPATGAHWLSALAPLTRDRIEVSGPKAALATLTRSPAPDAILIGDDPQRPGTAARLLSDLRCRVETLHSAILIVQDQPDIDGTVMALDLGASDLIDSGFDAAEIVLRLRRELARKARADTCRAALQDGLRLAATDSLTGLSNRRYALTALARIATGAERTRTGFAVMVLDLDRFKRINDFYGHAAGDAVLTEVAARMNACLRRDDLLARVGGEEFLAVIRDCDLPRAVRTAERLRRAIADRKINLPGGKGAVRVTASIGLVLAGSRREDPNVLIDRADRALYGAKSDGRNQVTVSRSAA